MNLLYFCLQSSCDRSQLYIWYKGIVRVQLIPEVVLQFHLYPHIYFHLTSSNNTPSRQQVKRCRLMLKSPYRFQSQHTSVPKLRLLQPVLFIVATPTNSAQHCPSVPCKSGMRTTRAPSISASALFCHNNVRLLWDTDISVSREIRKMTDRVCRSVLLL